MSFGARAAKFVQSIASMHARAKKGSAALFAVLSLETGKPAAASSVAALGKTARLEIPETLAALWSLHRSITWRWHLRDESAAGGFELLAPSAVAALQRGPGMGELLPFARIEPAGDLVALRRARSGAAPQVVRWVHDRATPARAIGKSFDAWIAEQLADGFVEYAASPKKRRDVSAIFAGTSTAAPAASKATPKISKPVAPSAPASATGGARMSLFTAVRGNRVADARALVAARPKLRRDDPAVLLGLSAKEGRGPMCEVLLALPLDPGYRFPDDGTLLHRAALGGVLAVVNALLAKKADPNARNMYGAAPLHHAATIEIARALLDAGADPSIRAANGKTALQTLLAERKAVGKVVESYARAT